MHGHMIIFLKRDTCNAYMNIQPRGRLASSLSIGSWFIRCMYILIQRDYDIGMIFCKTLIRLLVVLVVELLFSCYCRNCEGICNLTCLWLSCTKWLFDHSFDLLYLVEVQLETIMLNAMTTNENKYHDLQPRSQRKDGHITITKTFAGNKQILQYQKIQI